MNAWGWALIHFLWQGALVALALAVVLRRWRAKGPEFRYLAACVALGVMVMAVPGTALVVAGQDAPATVLLAGVGSRVVLDEAIAVAAEGLRLEMRWLVSLWAAGAALLLLRAYGGWYVARRRTLAGVPLDYPLSRLMDRMEMTGAVELMESAAARTPQVFGWLRPVIVVPAAMLARLSTAEFEALLAHELAHIRRRDYLVNLAQTVVEAVLFYHPAVWWVSRRIREERELCCDDWAVGVCGDRVAYSKALMKVEEESPMMVMAASATGLKARIARLLGMESDVKWRWSVPMAPLAAAAIALMLVSGPWWMAAAQPEPPAAPPAPAAPAIPAEPAVDADPDQPPPPPPAPPAAPEPPAPPEMALLTKQLTDEQRAEVERAMAEFRAQEGKIREEVQRAMELARNDLEKLNTVEMKRAMEHAMQQLREQQGQSKEALQRAMEQVRKDLEKVDTAEARRAMERAKRQLERQEGGLERQIAQAQRSMERALAQSERAREGAEERRKEQERRIQFADERFGQGSVKGSETDRGRTYRRYGPPDEIDSRPGQGEQWKYRNFRGMGGTMVFEFEGPELKLKSKPK